MRQRTCTWVTHHELLGHPLGLRPFGGHALQHLRRRLRGRGRDVGLELCDRSREALDAVGCVQAAACMRAQGSLVGNVGGQRWLVRG
eukprot:360895-Chlamydomonas_euryale.AAC.2